MALVIGAAIVHEGRVLAARRTRPAEVAGGWEFPGGKVEPGEDPTAAIVREVAEELGCSIDVVGYLTGEEPVSHGHTLRVALARSTFGEPIPREGEHDAIRWLGPEELDLVTWLDADRPFLPELREVLLDGARLDGGNLSGAVRIGGTVRRAAGLWTPAVHAVLEHLAACGMPAVPQVMGTDARGREVLTYLPGRVIDVDHDQLTEAQLASLASWTRRLHETLAGFTHPGPWRFPVPDHAEVVAHNDLGPYNVCFAGDRVAGVFDWDLAGPSTPALELGQLAWSCVPLFRDIGAGPAAHRLTILAEAYGVSAHEVLHAVPRKVAASAAAVRAAVVRGDATMQGLVAVGEPDRSERRLVALLDRIPAIEKELP